MKTSNKILLGTFLTALLILISVHVALYAKYKRGEYTLLSDEWLPNLATFSLNDVKYVSLDNIENVTIHFADSSKLQYQKPEDREDNILSLSKKDDTLFVTGKSKTDNMGRWYRQTDLYLSDEIEVKAVNSQLHLGNDSRSVTGRSLLLWLDKGSIDINNKGKQTPLNTVRINAVNRSRVMLNDVRIMNLSVSLRHSFLETNSLAADSITIKTDPASEIKLSAENLLKAKIAGHE